MRWTNGKRTVSDTELKEIVTESAQAHNRFEDDFNDNYTPIEVLHRCSGWSGYNSEFDDWLESEFEDDPVKVAGMVGFRPAAGNPNRKPAPKKSGSGCKSKPKNKPNGKPKANQARKPAPKRRSGQPRKANGQFAKTKGRR